MGQLITYLQSWQPSKSYFIGHCLAETGATRGEKTAKDIGVFHNTFNQHCIEQGPMDEIYLQSFPLLIISVGGNNPFW